MDKPRVLLVVSTGETAKAALGLRWAAAASESGWVDSVEVALFGPVQEALARGEKALLDALERVRKAGVPVYACQRYAEARGILSSMEGLGLTVEVVGERIARRAGEGYVVLVF